MENKDRLKFEWELFKTGIVLMLRKLFNLVTFVALLFGTFILLTYLGNKYEIDGLSSELSLAIAMVIAGVIHLIFFPWLKKYIVKNLSAKEVKK